VNLVGRMSTTDIKGGLTAIMRLSIRRRLSKIAQPGGELNSRVGTTRYVTGLPLGQANTNPNTNRRNPMARDEHNKAAEHHENAAKSHRAAAEHHGKGDHTKGKEHSTSAQQHSQNARQHSEQAHTKSQQQK